MYFSAELLKEFIVRAQAQACISVCALKVGATTTISGANLQEVRTYPDRVEYGLTYFPDTEFRQDSQALIIDPDEFSAAIAMPKHMCGADEYAIPLTEKYVIQIDHWVNLWVANWLTAISSGARLQKYSKGKQLFLALKARSFNKWSILRQLNEIGANCDIHPTAYIEGSILGNNVTLGAGAIVRNSVVGNNVLLGNGVVVEQSVIGGNSTVLNGHVLFSVIYPSSFSVAGFITASFMGRDTFAGYSSIMSDFRFDKKNVIVRKRDGSLVDSGSRFLGVCLGHGVYLGAGSVVAPGRSVPGGLRIALGEERIIQKFPKNAKEINGFRLL